KTVGAFGPPGEKTPPPAKLSGVPNAPSFGSIPPKGAPVPGKNPAALLSPPVMGPRMRKGSPNRLTALYWYPLSRNGLLEVTCCQATQSTHNSHLLVRPTVKLKGT